MSHRQICTKSEFSKKKKKHQKKRESQQQPEVLACPSCRLEEELRREKEGPERAAFSLDHEEPEHQDGWAPSGLPPWGDSASAPGLKTLRPPSQRKQASWGLPQARWAPKPPTSMPGWGAGRQRWL